MLFNSIDFFFFLPMVFVLYWFVFGNSARSQNILILISSYVFYSWWDYRFLSLIVFSTVVDYTLGLRIHNEKKDGLRKLFLFYSIFINLGILGFFKYYNFFIESWIDLFRAIGFQMSHVNTLNIILPVGISFYTFQTMSYTIDVYNRKLKPTKDFISFASFVSFFPQLVAGPIEKAINLLPQISNKRTFSYEQSVQGLRLVLWGMFKKVVVADSLAPIVDEVFTNYANYGSISLLLAAIYFSFQIYCDFSGYSDIAIGIAKLFGFELMSNFKFPYFSRNIAEFWRRWHISLSTWFRDYLYIQLGGSRLGKRKTIRNIFLIFIVSGFWHGANWTFIFWGLIHTLLYLPGFILNTNRKYTNTIVAENKRLPSFIELCQISKTFFFTTLAWIFFRSNSIGEAFSYIAQIASFENKFVYGKTLIIFPLFLICFEFLFRNDERLILNIENKYLRHLIYLLLSVLVILFFNQDQKVFIYFNF